jgi:CRISPR-associated protein Csc1
MRLYHCELTFHDNLFYETRTMGRLYETGRLLHNIALCYALGLAQTPYHHADHVPRYADELAALNEQGIYVTPATDLAIYYEVHTFKLGQERGHTPAKMPKGARNRNIPIYGRAKEIGVGSRFAFGVLTPEPLTLPRWIRMGIWMSKARLEAEEVALRRIAQRQEQVSTAYPVNPTDLPPDATIKVFDLVSMRPTSLLQNALIECDGWWMGETARGEAIWLPVGLRHRVGEKES